MRHARDGQLDHATTRERADAALPIGMPAHRSCRAVREIAEYLREVIDDDNDEGEPRLAGVLLSARPSAFDDSLPGEDTTEYEEPITWVIGRREKEIHAARMRDPTAWRRSYDQIGSVCSEGALPARALAIA